MCKSEEKISPIEACEKRNNHDIMSGREPEGACSLLANGEIME